MLRSETMRIVGTGVRESQFITDNYESKLREKDATISRLKETIMTLQKTATGESKIAYNE